MQTMYKAIPFSPVATITDDIGDGDTIIPVSDVAAFPEAPNIAVIGGVDAQSETIIYTAKTESALSGCTRGVEGAAKAWSNGEIIARNFTAKDHDTFIANIKELFNKVIKSSEINEAGHLIITLQDNSTFDAGYAKGDKGDKGDTGATGPTGGTGPAGQNGADGKAATIEIGTVTTGEPGTQAQVTNAGTSSAARLNFVIPKGEKGATGEKGETGGTGPQGANGSDGADATINGVNALTLQASGGLSGSQSGGVYTISGANLLPKSGGTMTGDIAMDSHKITGALSGTDYTTYRARGIALVSAAPSSLSNGCIAIVYS